MRYTEFQLAVLVNRLLVGMILIIAGVVQYFFITPEGLANILTVMGFPIELYLSWAFMVLEVLLGIAVLINWQVRYTALLSTLLILSVAFTYYLYGPGAVGGPNLVVIATSLIVASNYWLISTDRI
ncbi:hypothetical protein COU54_05810 [Candidatus Pacearchaeota archaeon CG10_big_fil_rev_8_21_14_0_10_31_24]|nr:MAG: hypothetical protein COU54_05810 [Candidatus Pacearchaeota archaeon CG10_big_fil_rev_8_21_14_0_10_31_24]